MPRPLTTVVSTKGQVILPKAVRRQRNWEAGTRLLVEETDLGVLLRPVPLFDATKISDVFCSLKTAGPAKTIEDMDAAVLAEARSDFARD